MNTTKEPILIKCFAQGVKQDKRIRPGILVLEVQVQADTSLGVHTMALLVCARWFACEISCVSLGTDVRTTVSATTSLKSETIHTECECACRDVRML